MATRGDGGEDDGGLATLVSLANRVVSRGVSESERREVDAQLSSLRSVPPATAATLLTAALTSGALTQAATITVLGLLNTIVPRAFAGLPNEVQGGVAAMLVDLALPEVGAGAEAPPASVVASAARPLAAIVCESFATTFDWCMGRAMALLTPPSPGAAAVPTPAIAALSTGLVALTEMLQYWLPIDGADVVGGGGGAGGTAASAAAMWRSPALPGVRAALLPHMPTLVAVCHALLAARPLASLSDGTEYDKRVTLRVLSLLEALCHHISPCPAFIAPSFLNPLAHLAISAFNDENALMQEMGTTAMKALGAVVAVQPLPLDEAGAEAATLLAAAGIVFLALACGAVDLVAVAATAPDATMPTVVGGIVLPALDPASNGSVTVNTELTRARVGVLESWVHQPLCDYVAAVVRVLLLRLDGEGTPFPLPAFIHLLFAYTLAQPDASQLMDVLPCWAGMCDGVMQRAAAGGDEVGAGLPLLYQQSFTAIAQQLVAKVQHACNHDELAALLREEEGEGGGDGGGVDEHAGLGFRGGAPGTVTPAPSTPSFIGSRMTAAVAFTSPLPPGASPPALSAWALATEEPEAEEVGTLAVKTLLSAAGVGGTDEGGGEGDDMPGGWTGLVGGSGGGGGGGVGVGGGDDPLPSSPYTHFVHSCCVLLRKLAVVEEVRECALEAVATALSQLVTTLGTDDEVSEARLQDVTVLLHVAGLLTSGRDDASPHLPTLLLAVHGCLTLSVGKGWRFETRAHAIATAAALSAARIVCEWVQGQVTLARAAAVTDSGEHDHLLQGIMNAILHALDASVTPPPSFLAATAIALLQYLATAWQLYPILLSPTSPLAREVALTMAHDAGGAALDGGPPPPPLPLHRLMSNLRPPHQAAVLSSAARIVLHAAATQPTMAAASTLAWDGAALAAVFTRLVAPYVHVLSDATVAELYRDRAVSDRWSRALGLLTDMASGIPASIPGVGAAVAGAVDAQVLTPLAPVVMAAPGMVQALVDIAASAEGAPLTSPTSRITVRVHPLHSAAEWLRFLVVVIHRYRPSLPDDVMAVVMAVVQAVLPQLAQLHRVDGPPPPGLVSCTQYALRLLRGVTYPTSNKSASYRDVEAAVVSMSAALQPVLWHLASPQGADDTRSPCLVAVTDEYALPTLAFYRELLLRHWNTLLPAREATAADGDGATKKRVRTWADGSCEEVVAAGMSLLCAWLTCPTASPRLCRATLITATLFHHTLRAFALPALQERIVPQLQAALLQAWASGDRGGMVDDLAAVLHATLVHDPTTFLGHTLPTWVAAVTGGRADGTAIAVELASTWRTAVGAHPATTLHVPDLPTLAAGIARHVLPALSTIGAAGNEG